MAAQVARTKTAPGSLNSATSNNCAKHENRLTIPSSAASEASPLQRFVRPIFAMLATLLDDDLAKARDLGPGTRRRGPRGSAAAPRAPTVLIHGESNAARHPQCPHEDLPRR